jgi:hypothetical protein
MSWFKIDDRSHHNAKVLAAGNEAWGAFCRAGAWASENLTDGLVPFSVALTISKKKIWKKLSESGLVVEEKTGFRIPKFLEYNPSAEEVRESRSQLSKTRAEMGRRGGLAKAENSPSKASKTPGKQDGKTLANGWQTPWQNPSPDPDPDPDPKEKHEIEICLSHFGPSPEAATNHTPAELGQRDISDGPSLATKAPRTADEAVGATLAASTQSEPVLGHPDATAVQRAPTEVRPFSLEVQGDPVKTPKTKKVPACGSRIAPDFTPSAETIARLREGGFLNPLAILEDFRDWWTAKSGKDATKLDWDATFRGWVRREGPSSPVHRPEPVRKATAATPATAPVEIYIPTDEERAKFMSDLRALGAQPFDFQAPAPVEPTEKRKPSEAEVAAYEAKRAAALAKAKLAFPDEFGDG